MTSSGPLRPDGPRVVALGGGHGLAATLQAARLYASSITAVVSVADDGGSSGRLRAALGIPAPGDLRRCLVALAEVDTVWSRTFEHRFADGDLEGHAVGNLVIAGLAGLLGDFRLALDEAGRLLGTVGTVLPATCDAVVLKAEVDGAGAVEGQMQVSHAAGRISRVSLVPPDARPPVEALDAIAVADQVVLGPGSLYSSVLAVVAVPAIREALASTRAQLVYVCNLRPEHPETVGLDAAGHVRALRSHGVEVDVVLHDPATLETGALAEAAGAAEVVRTALARDNGIGHDPLRLAGALADRLA